MPEPLEVSLPNDLEVVVTRRFDAPRAVVWNCHTKPELIQRWMLGPDGWTMPVCEMDLRVGGKFRWRWRSETDGSEFGFVGEFREIEKPARIVHTERVDGADTDDEMIVTQTLVERSGKTTLTVVMRFSSRQARDATVGTGMTTGMEAGYARLDGMFASESV